MGRLHKKPLIRVALSPNECAAVLDIRPDYVTQAIARGDLEVHPMGKKSRVLVIDLIAWVRTWKDRKERIAKIKRRAEPERDALIRTVVNPQRTEREKQAALRQLQKIEAAWTNL